MRPSTNELVAAVKEMRALQKAYFKGRNLAVLAQSKEAERRVDEIIDGWERPSLFDKGDDRDDED